MRAAGADVGGRQHGDADARLHHRDHRRGRPALVDHVRAEAGCAAEAHDLVEEAGADRTREQHEGLVAQLLEPQRARRLRADGRRGRTASSGSCPDDLDLDPLRRDRGTEQPGVEQPEPQEVDLLRRVRLAQRDLDPGRALSQLAHERRQDAVRERAHEAEREPAGCAGRDGRHHGERALRSRQGAPGLGQQGASPQASARRGAGCGGTARRRARARGGAPAARGAAAPSAGAGRRARNGAPPRPRRTIGDAGAL